MGGGSGGCSPLLGAITSWQGRKEAGLSTGLARQGFDLSQGHIQPRAGRVERQPNRVQTATPDEAISQLAAHAQTAGRFGKGNVGATVNENLFVYHGVQYSTNLGIVAILG